MSIADVVDGALATTTGFLPRIRILAVQSANGTLDATTSGYLQSGVVHTLDELDAVVAPTQAAGHAILDGHHTMTLQIGAESGNTLDLTFDRADRTGLGVEGVGISSQDRAVSALDILANAIDRLDEQRTRTAAARARLEESVVVFRWTC